MEGKGEQCLQEIRKEGHILFNDALNTFYLRLYGVRHMVKDHSDSEKGNLLPPHRLLFPISSNSSFYMHHPTDRIAHTMAFVTPVVEHWLEREIGIRWETPQLHQILPQFQQHEHFSFVVIVCVCSFYKYAVYEIDFI